MKLSGLAGLAIVLLLAGCDSISHRIKERSAAFGNWKPTTQERIKRGDLRVGDNLDMVYIVLGKPDSKEEIKHDDGSVVGILNYPKIVQKFMSEEIVGYEEYSEYDVATGQRIHYKVPNRQKVYQNKKQNGLQVFTRNGLVTSVRWGSDGPPQPASADETNS